MPKDKSLKMAVAAATAASPGVTINLVSRKKLQSLPTQEKIRFILDEVKANKILVLEEGLDAREEAQLIERTMTEIDPDTFIGIEMESHHAETTDTWMEKLVRRATGTRGSMSVVGPADKLRTVSKDGNTISALILTSAPPPAGA